MSHNYKNNTTKMGPFLILLLITQNPSSINSAFLTPNKCPNSRSSKLALMRKGPITPANHDNTLSTNSEVPTQSRRDILSQITASIFLPVVAAMGAGGVEPAVAKFDDKPNPLLNPVLEQIRIFDQAEADNIRYGGELAPGSPLGRKSYAELLVPILDIDSEITTLNELVREPDGAGLARASDILAKPYYQKIGFKKVFNAFADNIYYSDPDRANVYLGGGATPKNEQSIAYLLRNDVLTNIEALQAEVEYLLKEKKKIDNGTEKGPLETEDLYAYAQIAKDGMARYLALVPPKDMKAARELVASR